MHCLEEVEEEKKEKAEGWWGVFTAKKPKGNTVNLGGGKKKVCNEGRWWSYRERETNERGQRRE